MALLGQASGDFTESSAALRVLHQGIFNTTSPLALDGFSQANPPIVTVASTFSAKLGTGATGVLSGSVAFSRPDQGSNVVGGPVEGLAGALGLQVVPRGVFMLNANGNAFENQPALASGINTFCSAQGTYGNRLYETQVLAAAAPLAQGDDLIYQNGQELVASRNGYLMPRVTTQTGAAVSLDIATITSQVANGQAASTLIAILSMSPDSAQNEIVYDQRI